MQLRERERAPFQLSERARQRERMCTKADVLERVCNLIRSCFCATSAKDNLCLSGCVGHLRLHVCVYVIGFRRKIFVSSLPLLFTLKNNELLLFNLWFHSIQIQRLTDTVHKFNSFGERASSSIQEIQNRSVEVKR